MDTRTVEIGIQQYVDKVLTKEEKENIELRLREIKELQDQYDEIKSEAIRKKEHLSKSTKKSRMKSSNTSTSIKEQKFYSPENKYAWETIITNIFDECNDLPHPKQKGKYHGNHRKNAKNTRN